VKTEVRLTTVTTDAVKVSPDRVGGWVVAALIAVALLLRVADPLAISWVRNFAIVFGSLLVEAVPFVFLGAFVSAAIEIFVPASSFVRIATLPRALQLPAAAAAGLAFPVCECGSVPVARRMIQKGAPPGAAVAFMLAAPIVNPVVIASTWVAYQGRAAQPLMVLGRLGLALLVAVAVGWVIGSVKSTELVRANPGVSAEITRDHSRKQRFFGHLAGDMIFMARFLILGAAIAAAVQTFLPQTVADRVADLPVLSIAAMMGLAFVMSLCSESDAFVAASFVSFGAAAQLAFLVSGPMLDMKLVALYGGTYGSRFVRVVAATVLATTLTATLWIELVFG
jgi:hypothetical protein